MRSLRNEHALRYILLSEQCVGGRILMLELLGRPACGGGSGDGQTRAVDAIVQVELPSSIRVRRG